MTVQSIAYGLGLHMTYTFYVSHAKAPKLNTDNLMPVHHNIK